LTTSELILNKEKRAMAENAIYHKGGIKITTNSCDEIFIEDTKSGTVMRLSTIPKGGLEFTTQGNTLVEPVRISNMIGWHVKPR
jgi:hypothetical protein